MDGLVLFDWRDSSGASAVLRLIGILALVYLAYWAGSNGVGVGDLVEMISQAVDTHIK